MTLGGILYIFVGQILLPGTQINNYHYHQYTRTDNYERNH